MILDRVRRLGSLRFDEYLELALYAPGQGFFAVGGGAGRGGRDFITSPEVGPLFGAVVARWLDDRWDALGRPDPFVVVEAAAGRGALALSVLAADPACAPALRYVLVERSAVLRERQAEHLALVPPVDVLGPDRDLDDPDEAAASGGGDGPAVCSLEDLPATAIDGVVLCNELLDDIPFRLLERRDGSWHEVRVAESTGSPGELVELLVPADDAAARAADHLVPDPLDGARIPLQQRAGDWLRRALDVVRSGSVLVVDYAEPTTAALATASWWEWVRTYAGQGRGGHPLDAPGAQDITVEVALDQLGAVREPDDVATQADWLRRWGIDDLVEEGRRAWAERAAVADLAALRARSRAVEAEALCDPTGLGGFTVAEWRTGP
jgi:SAM-dependent MidA family methyltransferase